MKQIACLLFFILLISGFNGCSKTENNTSTPTPPSPPKVVKSDSVPDKNTVAEIKSDSLKDSTSVSVISTNESSIYLGKKVIVKGIVAQIFSKDSVTYLNIDKKFPVNKFFAVIFSDKLSLFPDIKKCTGKQVEIEGVITKYKGKSEIILNDPKMIRLSAGQ